MSLQHKFENLVSFPLTSVSAQNLKVIALGFWYENYTPKLETMNSIQLRRAGYLIDLLASFNCVGQMRQLELMALTQKIRQKLPNLQQGFLPVPIVDLSSLDPIAQEWYLSEDISTAIQPLLKYQTRHYLHS